MMRQIFLALVALAAFSTLALAEPTALFYLGSSPASVRDFLEHSAQIGIIVPTWYQVDQQGLLTGGPNSEVLDRARQEKLPVVPLVALFSKSKFHTLASSSEAQERMNQALLREARQYGYTGFQIDFENIEWTDRDLLSALVARTAAALHAEGLQLSIATVPNAPGYPGQGGFSKWIYTDWRGAYDLEALAKSVDLICLMTYDQHTRWTTPGPVAGWQWTVENIDYALKSVPKEKLSMGIPLYGYHWYSVEPLMVNNEETPHLHADSISAIDAAQLARSFHVAPQWDAEDHGAFYYFYRDQMREWVFYTDERTFADRYRLVKERGLQGFCSWVLGEEDPAIWKLLAAKAR